MKLPRLYPILDTELLQKRSLPLPEAAEAMLAGGAQILQLRHKGQYSRRVFEEAERLGELCRKYKARWIVDDRTDIARLLDASLHLGQEDLQPEHARKIIGPDTVIGFSTHNAEQMLAAKQEPVDYLAIGPIFQTASKFNPDPVVGLAKLEQWRSLTDRPLVAIGGITRGNAASVLAAGADSVAVISDLIPETCTIKSLQKRIEEWLQIIKI